MGNKIPEIEPFDKAKAIMKIIRAEMYYLGNCGWLMYCGTPDDKFWAHSDEPKALMSQREAMRRQREIDKF